MKFSTFVHTRLNCLMVILVVFSLQGCNENKDEESPRVIIESPYENQNFSTVDTLTIFANITDNEKIKSIEISLLDTDYNGLGIARSYQTSGSPLNFLTDFILDEPFLNSGVYNLAVRANDGENTGSGYVQIHLTAVERVIENYLVVTKNSTEAGVYLGSEINDWQEKGVYSIDLSGAALNYRQNILGLAGGVIGDAVFYEIEEFDVVATIPGFGGNSLPYFFGLEFSAKAERFYLMQRDPQLRILDKYATPVSAAQLIPNFLPEKVFSIDDDIFVLQKSITSPTLLMGRYASSGLLLNSYTMSGPVKEVAKKSQSETYVWEDGANGASMLILNSGNNLMESAYLRQGETLHAAKEIGNGSFIISTSTGLYRYDYSGGTTVLNTLIESLTALYYDDLNGIIYGTAENKLYQISTTGVVINTYTFADSIAYFAVNYNR
ncbi:hypothetical protein G3O08_04370 [Cryomorpha ignava]|uniref:Uncharacterized protein n=1 Tax=Cryomorpha ignava TaxID=101383 RepID=A0A7K3WM66_9FLAO|nr:hypothetical protein [Cryomorpha ignava]NEN22740.1 hypothetical protein [Cryomorpha ignava]